MDQKPEPFILAFKIIVVRRIHDLGVKNL